MTIKNRGKCPCPRCLISRQAKVDGARRLIYEKHYALDGNAINGLLQAQSLVPMKVNLLVGVCLNT